jgi:hypothetical protein
MLKLLSAEVDNLIFKRLLVAETPMNTKAIAPDAAEAGGYAISS